ncbi:uncharacterized protein C8Q71DRAFT_858367 [Rhodofomes roseus]|uniref:DUF6533 domain-containing protein n=1 Tax=Rhodofomes roseus TaxID=34475 RepID=A0ABQ8KG84_9APHY|nr:uncharacterized protein C8Q71DRAFT_858367 [Rhodofomes roseus]KAH9836385.1 hypothetical protein C8Q71DRAFT_858367 [Rhodofomes roseus]
MVARMGLALTPAEATQAEVFFRFYYYFENFLYFSATTLCCYDWCLTLGREIDLIWKSEQSLVTILFYGLRYPAVLNTVIELLSRITWRSWQSNARFAVALLAPYRSQYQLNESSYSCAILLRTQVAFAAIILTSAAVFASLRIYAVFDRNRWIAIAVLLLGLIYPFIVVFVFSYSTPVVSGFLGYQVCTIGTAGGDATDDVDWSTWAHFMMGARAAALLSDGLVMVLTAFKTFRIKTRTSVTSRGRMVTDIMLRDTLLYFTLLCIVNITGIATGHMNITIGGLYCTCEFIEVWQLWSTILTSVLLTRLTLDLRDAGPLGSDRSGTTSTQGGSEPATLDGESHETIELDTGISPIWMSTHTGTDAAVIDQEVATVPPE